MAQASVTRWARTYFHYWAIFNNENVPNSINICHDCSRCGKILNNLFKIAQGFKIFVKGRIFAKSGYTACKGTEVGEKEKVCVCERERERERKRERRGS